jgi:hypothetical protein
MIVFEFRWGNGATRRLALESDQTAFRFAQSVTPRGQLVEVWRAGEWLATFAGATTHLLPGASEVDSDPRDERGGE